PALPVRHRRDSSAMDDLDARVVRIDTAITEIDNDLLRCAADVLEKNARLLELRRQGVPVVRVARESARTDDESLTMRDGDARLHTELVGLACLPLADALDLDRKSTRLNSSHVKISY